MKTILNFPTLSVKEDFKPLLKLAIPLVLTGIVQSSVGFFETIFLARLGEQILAAGALVTTLFFTLIVILFGTFSSVNILIAHKQGANDVSGISLVLRDGLLLAILLAIPAFLLFWTIAPIFLLFGQKPELVALANLYLHGLAWGLLPKFILIVLEELIIGLGHSRVILKINLLSIPLYIFFSFVLIFGKLGFPKLGIAGAGWGMTLGDWLTTISLCCYLLLNKKYQPYVQPIFKFSNPIYLGEIIQLGLPMGLMYFLEVGFFFAMTILIGIISIQALAANQIAMQFLGPLMGIIFCIAQAITVRMGHKLGANQAAAAERAAYAGIILSTSFMLMLAVIYWTIPEMLIAVDFNLNNPNNLETIRIAKQFFFIAAFFQIFESIRIALFGSLRGLKDTKFSLFTSAIGFWCISLPIGYLLSIHFKMGGDGFWWAMILGAACSTFLLFLRFKHKIEHEKTINSLNFRTKQLFQ